MSESRLKQAAHRERRILELLQESSVLSVAEIAAELDVSEATVRRCLQSMDERNLLHRVHGGASLPSFGPKPEPVFQDKEALHREAKETIADLARGLVEEHQRIYLDGGSTALLLARRLHDLSDLTVVTNSLMAAAEFMTTHHRLILVGGEFRALSRTLVGPLSASVIQSLHVDIAFMGTIGFTVEEGMSTTDPAEAYTKEQIMRRADRVVLLADSSKLGHASFARSGRVDEVDTLVTERIPEGMVGQLGERGVRILTPGDKASVALETGNGDKQHE